MRLITLALFTLQVLTIGSGCDSQGELSSNHDASSFSKTNVSAPLNVILISIDTLRADALGAYGQPLRTSPNIDRLAKEGVVFLQAMTAGPSTLPSHASIMTSNYPHVHGARSNNGYLVSESNETLAEILKHHGYRTAAEVAASVVNRTTRLDQGFTQYRDLDSPDIQKQSVQLHHSDGSLETVEISERPAIDITNRGIEFIQDQSKETPFFLWLHYFDPHALYNAPPEWQKLLPENDYHAEVRYVDAQIGRLISEIERLRLKERTIVAITSDHGEGLNEHDEGTHSFFVYETTMRVPLIFWGAPSVLQQRRVKSLVRTIDIAPTLLNLLDLPPMQNVQGLSLLPLITGEISDLGVTGIGESIELQSIFGSSILRTVRRNNWKYIHKLRPELFDLEHDASELNNLADRHPEKIEEFSQALHQSIANAPKSPKDARVAMDEKTLRELEALGYAAAAAPRELGEELKSLKTKGPDPTDTSQDLRKYNTGTRFIVLEQYLEAVEILEGLASSYPDSSMILTNLGEVLNSLARHEEAVRILRQAVELHPKNTQAYDLLARAELALGNFDQFEAASHKTIALVPCASSARLRFAKELGKRGRHDEQIATLSEGADNCPSAYELLNNLAYLLSTSPKAHIRNGREAIRIAKLALAGSGGDDPFVIDTLAAAYAEAGEFQSAVATSSRAIEIASKRGDPPGIIAALKKNQDLFRLDRPSRQE